MEGKTEIKTQAEFDSKLSYTHDRSLCNISLTNCVIKCQIDFPTDINIIKLNCCDFQKSVEFKGSVKNDANFYDCKFSDLRLLNAKFNGKTRFRECDFHQTTFDNTSFNELADFWSSKFHDEVIFYKVDFFKTTVFSDCTFEKNTLFTYTVIDSKLILRQANFKKGLDLALSIIGGELVLFDLDLKKFKSVNRELTADEYAYEIRLGGRIALKNKRETFRILHHQFKTLGNTREAIKFKTYERDSIKRETIENVLYPFVQPIRYLIQSTTDSKYFKRIKHTAIHKRVLNIYLSIKKQTKFSNIVLAVKDYISNFSDLIVLGLNKISNNHGKSYFYGVIFTFVIAAIFFQLSIINTQHYTVINDIQELSFENFVEVSPYFWQSLLPTHKFSYMEELQPNHLFYLYDFLGRIFIGYGIYQTIQAFRKYK